MRHGTSKTSSEMTMKTEGFIDGVLVTILSLQQRTNFTHYSNIIIIDFEKVFAIRLGYFEEPWNGIICLPRNV